MIAAAGWRAGDGADGFVVAALARLRGFPAMGFPSSLLLSRARACRPACLSE